MPQTKAYSILIVDDNHNVRTALELLLSRRFGSVCTLDSPKTLLRELQAQRPDVLLLDMNFSAGTNSGGEGLYWLQEVHKRHPDLPVVLFTAYADVALAVDSLKRGAADFVVKPWDNQRLLETLEAAIVKQTNRKRSTSQQTGPTICRGRSQAMRQVLSVAERVAKTEANVLITGENGTGKDVLARHIHDHSSRTSKPFVSVDMGAIPPTLFESELFGHKRGAFTDAYNDRSGRIEEARGGTLLLDEIGNMPPALQVKLLSALESRHITPVGSDQSIEIDIRLLSATNAHLQDAVANGSFRQDLLYRINTIRIEMPPLRQRPEDVEELAGHFLSRYTQRYNRPSMTLSAGAIKALEQYRWPGNVRELKHVIEKAVILCDGEVIYDKDLDLSGEEETKAASDIALGTLSLDEMEQRLVRAALEQWQGNVSVAAASLGISRTTLYAKMRKWGLQEPDDRKSQ